jgi:hypothetical protein
MKPLPLSLKIVTGYLIFIGALGIAWPLLGFGPHNPEFEAQSLSYKIWAYFKDGIYNVLYLSAGIGIILRKKWARRLGLALLVITTISTANAFAWGRAGGPPETETLLVSFTVVGAWNVIWFYLLYKKTSKLALEPSNVVTESS